MMKLVERMLELNKKNQWGPLALSEPDRIGHHIAGTNSEIGNPLCEPHGTTDEELKAIQACRHIC